ncbi:MAG TPA: styrene monooxygenase/indole monooxygenase family protein [Actinomycetota bacterium]
MTKVLIVGGGQSGLQLGIGLLQGGFDVTVVSNRTPEDIHDGRVMSSQCMFANSLDTERRLGINFWEEACPPVEGISFTVPHPEQPGARAIDFASRLDRYAQATDQRVKFPRWLEHFESSGGRVEIHEAGVDDLERYATENDLVIVAAGKGEIARLFERDASRSPFDRPMRALALTYVTGMTPRPEYSAVCFNLAPGVGEYFVFPALTTTGPCEIMVFEGVPGGPMDCWGDVETPEQHLTRSVEILDSFFPWEADRNRDVELTDPNGILAGRVPPTVRKPIGRLPSGRAVLGMADAVVLNDPITGQGSNNAAKCADAYLDSILERPEGPYDEAWMQATFDRYWAYAEAVVEWTNALLTPPPEHVLQLLGAAGQDQRIAHRFVNGFDDPRDYRDWFMDPAKADAYLAQLAAA